MPAVSVEVKAVAVDLHLVFDVIKEGRLDLPDCHFGTGRAPGVKVRFPCNEEVKFVTVVVPCWIH